VRDMAVVITNGVAFDKAWRDVDPACVDNATATPDDMNASRSSVDCGGIDLSRISSIGRSSREAEYATHSDVSQHVLDLDQRLGDAKNTDNVSPEAPNTSLDMSISKHSLSPGSNKSGHSVPETKVPTEDAYTPSPATRYQAEVRRKFEEAVHERVSSVLGWRFTPLIFVWDEGDGGGLHPRIDSWLSERYRSQAQHVQAPNACAVIRDNCLPALRPPLPQQQTVGVDELLSATRVHIRCIQPVELRQAYHWLHLLGDVVALDTEELDPHLRKMWGDGIDSTLHRPAGRVDPKLMMKPLVEHQRSSKIQLDLEIMKRYAPKRDCKIVLDPAWLTRHFLSLVVGKSSSLSKSQASIQPWGDHEYLFTEKQLRDVLSPYQRVLNMTISEILIALEVQRIGVRLPSINAFFVPCRIGGDKMKWIYDRKIANMALSQFTAYNRVEVLCIVAAIGRRIKPRKSFIIPPSAFSCFQSHILHIWLSERTESWKHFQVMLWERGVGVIVEQRVEQSHSQSAGEDCGLDADFPVGTGTGNVCVLIETNPKSIQPDWSQSPDSVIDIMGWGEGLCRVESIAQVVERLCDVVYEALTMVCRGALRSEGESVEALTVPSTDWLKTVWLRPGCFLHTLSGTTADRECGEYLEDADCHEPLDAPVLVVCHHMQPRLCKEHLRTGYILSDSPGAGKGMLRSVHATLERSMSISVQNSATAHHSPLQISFEELIGENKGGELPLSIVASE
jgi:hypothetical protein